MWCARAEARSRASVHRGAPQLATAQASLLTAAAAAASTAQASTAALAPGLAGRARRHFTELVVLPLPTPRDRRALLRRMLAPLAAPLGAAEIDAVADECHGFLPSDLAQLARAALLAAARDGAPLTAPLLARARRALVPSLLGDVAVHALAAPDAAPQPDALAIAGLERERRVLQETLLVRQCGRATALRAAARRHGDTACRR